jgi:iron complex outermembrane recepter protein
VNRATQSVYSTPENFKWTRFAYCSVIFNKELFKWWTLNLSGYLRYGFYNGFDGSSYVRANGQGYAINMTSEFDFKEGWKAEAIVYFDSKWRGSVTQSADANVFMIFGISKKVNERLTIKAAANDPFGIYRITAHNMLYNFRSDASYTYASMRYDIGFTWNFGKSKFKEHEVNAPEETKRMKID